MSEGEGGEGKGAEEGDMRGGGGCEKDGGGRDEREKERREHTHVVELLLFDGGDAWLSEGL